MHQFSFSKVAVLLRAAVCFSCGNSSSQTSAGTEKKPDSLSGPPVAVQRDTTYDRFVPDTSTKFESLDQLREYKMKIDQQIFDYSKQKLKENPENVNLEYQLDSVKWHIQDNFAYLIYQQLWKSEKTDKNIILVSFSSAFSSYVTIEDRMRLFAAYPKSVQDGPSGKAALKLMKNSMAYGNIGRDMNTLGKLNMQDSSGRTLSFGKAINNDAEYTLLIFTASWCSPCRYEAAFLNRELDKMDTGKVKLISISIENKRDKWLRFIRKDANPWPQYFHPGEMESPLAKSIDFSSIPLNLLLDRDKKVIAQDVNVKVILKKWPQLYKG